MDLEQFKAEDLLMDESFLRYCLGTDEQARTFWENHIANHPDHRTEIEKAKQLLSVMNGGITADSIGQDRSIFFSRLMNEGIISAEPAKVVRMKPFNVKRLLAVAAILLITLTGLYFIFQQTDKPGQVAKTETKAGQIVPGGDKAILTLANGTTIVLDSAAAGNIAVQGGVNVVKGGGQLSYQGTANTSEVLYNTVSTPKGGQYLLSLADGSRVWLNAASSLRFPTAFRGADRLVELTGEGFFEVAHNSQKPFHVQVNDMQVKVLGTQFNINGYADDGNMRTTLIEGSVMVSSEKLGRSAVLKPGQQAVLKINALDVEKDVDTEEVMAWKTGYFIFNDRSVEEIMKQVSRWYDVDVMYESLVEPKYFSGAVKRKGDISDVLKIMEQAGVKFKQEGRKIIVTQ